MAGVTHFEKRAQRGAKKVHPFCPFCHKVFRATPKTIVASGGPLVYIAAFKQHLMDCLGPAPMQPMVAAALDAASEFAPMIWNNC